MSDEAEMRAHLAGLEFEIGVLAGQIEHVRGPGEAIWVHLRKLARAVMRHERLELYLGVKALAAAEERQQRAREDRR